MKSPVPRIYLGTMTFAWSQTSSVVDEPVALEMLRRFVAHNEEFDPEAPHRVDTASIYAGGKTEPMVGSVLGKLVPNIKGRVLVGTKAHPSREGGLSEAGIQRQLKASMEGMSCLQSLDEYYLHQPDTERSLLESLRFLHSLVQEGVISSIGMSNYHASEMERAFALCEEHGLTAPTVYQGLYNPLNRAVEDQLLPVLKRNNCSFVAFNPLAAGLLSGKHTDPDRVMKGRFKKNQNYLPRFYTKSNFEAVETIRGACEKEGISMVEATYRWLLRHSSLDPGNDGVLIGASSLDQLEQNLAACAAAREGGPLSDELLRAFERGWHVTREAGVFPYWRSYSADMPNRETLDQGASYDAAKKK